jgi:hypothetical protein
MRRHSPLPADAFEPTGRALARRIKIQGHIITTMVRHGLSRQQAIIYLCEKEKG